MDQVSCLGCSAGEGGGARLTLSSDVSVFKWVKSQAGEF